MASITYYLYYRETPEVVEKAKEMQAKYPRLKECAALVELGLTAANTVRCSFALIMCGISFLEACMYR